MTAVAALLLPAAAAAHAIILPSASRPAELQRYTLTVPNERNLPTVSVRLRVPAGINFFLAENRPGWNAHVQKSNGRIVAVVFDGGSIAPDFFDTFRFIAKNPVREGTIVWDVRQEYSNGEIVDWNGPPHSDTPASRTTVVESAAPVDVIDVATGTTASPAQTATAGAAGGSGRDWTALSLAALALVITVGGMLLKGFRGRPLT